MFWTLNKSLTETSMFPALSDFRDRLILFHFLARSVAIVAVGPLRRCHFVTSARDSHGATRHDTTRHGTRPFRKRDLQTDLVLSQSPSLMSVAGLSLTKGGAVPCRNAIVSLIHRLALSTGRFITTPLSPVSPMSLCPPCLVDPGQLPEQCPIV